MRRLKEQLITSQDILVKTVVGGGIVVREHRKIDNFDKYYTFMDSDFDENLKRVLKGQAELAGFDSRLVNEMEIEPVDCKKVIVKSYGAYVDTTVGVLKLHGNTELLQYFYKAGFGSRSSMGFGLIDVIAQDVIG